MNLESNIRPIVFQDISDLKLVIAANDLFPPDMLNEMMEDYLSNKNSQDIWLTYESQKPVVIAYCAPEKMTEGTWNLYLIAVHPDHQNQGYGTSILRYLEKMLAERGARILLVETSGLESFESTREFYRQRGYVQEARIREFYQAGEDKIIFRKSLLKTQA